MTEKALQGLRDHRLRRPQRRRAGDARPGSSTRTSSASSCSATSRSAGTRAASARSGTSATTCETRRTWDKRLGLGRQKIFEVRKLYNDVTFIDEFFTDGVLPTSKKFFSFSLQRTQRQLRDRLAASSSKVKEKLLFQLTNFGQPVHLRRGRQPREPRRAAAAPPPRGHRPARRPRPRDPDRPGTHLAPPGQPAHRPRRQGQAAPLRRQRTQREGGLELSAAPDPHPYPLPLRGRGRTIRSVSRIASRVPDQCLPSPADRVGGGGLCPP